jgi:hypothetical protein
MSAARWNAANAGFRGRFIMLPTVLDVSKAAKTEPRLEKNFLKGSGRDKDSEANVTARCRPNTTAFACKVLRK